MNILSRLRSRVSPAIVIGHEESHSNAYGGVGSRITPMTKYGDTFQYEPSYPLPGATPDLDMGPIIAARPPRAPALDDSKYNTQVPTATGFVRRTLADGFVRENEGTVHIAAVDSAAHISSPNVHPSVKRDNLRGNAESKG